MFQKNYKLFFRLCSIILLFAIIGSLLFFVFHGQGKNKPEKNNKISFKTMQSSNEDSEKDYINVSETDSLVMMANLHNGDFYVQNKITGMIWQSTPQNAEDDEITTGAKRTNLHSQLFFEYIYKSDEISAVSLEIANSYSDSLLENGIITKVIDNGICVTYYFNLLEISIPVLYTLSDDYLEAKIDFENIFVNDDIYLMSIALLPSFGANYDSNNGYLFIPDGSGAIVNFDNGINFENYEKLIYGDDLAISPKTKKSQEENIRMPVFGVKKENDSFIAIVIEGDKSTAICAYNKNDTCAYDTVFSKRILRTLTNKTIYEKDAANRQNIGRVTQQDDFDGFKIRYYFLTNDDSDYAGMANKYRKYLFNNVDKSDSKYEPAFNIEVSGAFDTRGSFLGIPYTKLEGLTSYIELKDILEILKNKGIDKINIRYNGWASDGLLNIRKLNKVNLISALGRKKDFNSLKQCVKNNCYGLFLDIDLLQYRKGSSTVATRDPFESITERYHYLRSVYTHDKKTDTVRLLSTDNLYNLSDDVLKSLNKIGDKSVSLGNIGDYLYSNFSERNFVSRTKSAEQIVKVLKNYTKQGYLIAVDGGNAFTLPYVDRVYHVPTSSSNYDFFNESIPFYQIVLNGIVKISGDPIQQTMEPICSYLKAVETGMELNYSCIFEGSEVLMGTRYDSLYSSTYTLWMDTAAKQYAKYHSLQNMISEKAIVEHGKISDDVYCTKYENGVKVIVNYSDSDFEYNGAVISKKDFCIVGKELSK